MPLSVAVANAIAKVDQLFDLVKGQYTKWDNQVKAKTAELESWKTNIPILQETQVLQASETVEFNLGRNMTTEIMIMSIIHVGAHQVNYIGLIRNNWINTTLNEILEVSNQGNYLSLSVETRNFDAILKVKNIHPEKAMDFQIRFNFLGQKPKKMEVYNESIL